MRERFMKTAAECVLSDNYDEARFMLLEVAKDYIDKPKEFVADFIDKVYTASVELAEKEFESDLLSGDLSDEEIEDGPDDGVRLDEDDVLLIFGSLFHPVTLVRMIA